MAEVRLLFIQVSHYLEFVLLGGGAGLTVKLEGLIALCLELCGWKTLLFSHL